MFSQIITCLLLGAKSMIQSVPKWTPDEDKTLPEGQFIFLQIIAYLLLGAKSMIKSVPKWTPDEDKTLPEVLPMGSQSDYIYDKKYVKSSILKDIEGY